MTSTGHWIYGTTHMHEQHMDWIYGTTHMHDQHRALDLWYQQVVGVDVSPARPPDEARL